MEYTPILIQELPQKTTNQINPDSALVMISEVEKHFNIKFKLKEILGFKNVGDMIRTIHGRLQNA